jgi:hypothetical protein
MPTLRAGAGEFERYARTTPTPIDDAGAAEVLRRLDELERAMTERLAGESFRKVVNIPPGTG